MKTHFIQRLEFCDSRYTSGDKSTTFSRFMRLDYMGSAEYEFGSVGRALRSIREKDMKLHKVPVTAYGKTLDFWVICADNCLQGLIEKLPLLAEGKIRTKERTDIGCWFHPEFNESTSNNGWLVIDDFVTMNDPRDQEVAFFTVSEAFASMFYCEYMRSNILGNIDLTFDVRMFDKVYIPGHKQLATVCGINEDGSYTVKFKNKKTKKVPVTDIWLEDKYPIAQLNAVGLT